MSEKGHLLLQENVDPPKKNLIDTDVIFVGPDRRVGRNQLDIPAGLLHGADQRVVVHATAAVHARGTRRNISYSLVGLHLAYVSMAPIRSNVHVCQCAVGALGPPPTSKLATS